MASKTLILLLGATGYLGGTVLARLLAHPNASHFEITTIVRDADKAKKLDSFGVKAVVGSFKSDHVLLQQHVEKAHVTFNCGDSDDYAFIEALLAGIKKRHAKSNDVPIFIHTSGTGKPQEIIDITGIFTPLSTAILTAGHETKGLAITDIVYNDSDFDQMERLPAEALHRNVDLAIMKADTEGYLKAYLVTPSTIFGVPTTPLVNAGIQNAHSLQFPWLIRASLGRGQAGMVGKGLAVWNAVHVDDVAELFIVLYNAVLKNSDAVDHGHKGYYFAENGEYTWYDVSKAIGRAMVELGLSKNDEPTTFTSEELVKYWGSEWLGNFWGSNARGRGNHSRALGWKPKYTTQDMISSIKPEVQYYSTLQK